jgi:hypothetical protein
MDLIEATDSQYLRAEVRQLDRRLDDVSEQLQYIMPWHRLSLPRSRLSLFVKQRRGDRLDSSRRFDGD